ncbi:CHAT domain-containing protein [Plantactinospora soyae]|uniref:CHAT domain-containing protein n=1 Tax=Plantactinospora soyae TaxID=1544732 RepID=A0A927QVH5_9ACTN|nr:CHAT domain-containing protein [Plantactinospora soyae]MBE1484382.1 hypothetical protein [Plantactinospora soyae]
MSESDRRMALAHEWDDLVARTRALPGFADFLRPPRLETLLPAVADGPVIILNVSRWRCDALIVRAAGPHRFHLPGLAQDAVGEHVERYLAAVGAHQGRRDATVDSEVGESLEPELERCLAWMWDSIAEPILDHLGYRSTPAQGTPWPRVWWCPTGALSLLPLHAAGHHRTPGAAVLDRVVSSYTPTLRALRRAGMGTAPAADADRMLFVGLPETPGQAPLPNVATEHELLAGLLPGRLTSLIGDRATRERVLRTLPAHAWVHFACHGDQNLDDPSSGALLVHDGPLTVTNLGALQYAGEFAYLSGCKTAVGGVRLPDEAITLAAALHYTGFRHVIATLWSVRDETAAQVAADVYAVLVRNGGLDPRLAAQALHHAIRELRRQAGPSAWTPFIHIGP